MEIEFLDWYSKNEDRFAHGQFDEKQIAYSAWLDGKKRNTKAENLPISDVVESCPKCKATDIEDTDDNWMGRNDCGHTWVG